MYKAQKTSRNKFEETGFQWCVVDSVTGVVAVYGSDITCHRVALCLNACYGVGNLDLSDGIVLKMIENRDMKCNECNEHNAFGTGYVCYRCNKWSCAECIVFDAKTSEPICLSCDDMALEQKEIEIRGEDCE